MKILSVEFITSGGVGGHVPGLVRGDAAQFAFVGRSNVGKSSLLNALAGQRVARTSVAAGKTRLSNVFHITAEGGPGGAGSWSTYFVDLPGYGYARGGHASVDELSAVTAEYFAERRRRQPRGATFLLVDSRHPGLLSDMKAERWLGELGESVHIIATKVDKVSRSERSRNLREFARQFGAPPLAVSSTSREGLDELWKRIAAMARPGL